ncbi:MAG TPA: hypothetical protein VLW75_03705, partial [Rhizomicrobium sp.]|nr:hypothetical protein [Rhizomicrobium sp.]
MAFSTVEAGRDRFGPPAVASWRPIAAALSKPANAVFLLIVAGSVIRVAMAAAVGLGSDESYAVANARMLALSYVDYPPLHAWLVWAWVSLTGSEA